MRLRQRSSFWPLCLLGLLLISLCASPMAWGAADVAPALFASTDTGAPVLSGQNGTLLTLWDKTLIINTQFTDANGANFVDNSTAARLQGSTAWALFQGPTTSTDHAYFGHQAKFQQILSSGNINTSIFTLI